MKILKLLVIAYLITKPALVQSQIIISEVNFDVPVLEKIYPNHPISKAHYGEFIELYNYSDEDISLKDWMLVDISSSFSFPNDAIIKSNNYIVVAFKHKLISADNPIIAFYPSSLGHEDKIIYQNSVILRNKREHIKLVSKRFRNIVIPIHHKIHDVYYRTQATHYNFPFYEINNGYQNTGNVNFQEFPSINYSYNNQQPPFEAITNIMTVNPPNPFSTPNNLPPLQDYDTLVIPILDNNYNHITYHDDVIAILNNTCDKTVSTIEQSPSLTLTTQKRCAVYDVSGNITHWTTCTNITPPPPVGYTEEQIQQIDAAITVFPNPTTGAVTTQWDTLYLGKIKLIHAATSAGNIFYTSPSLLNTTTAPVNLGNGSMGLYLITFVLDTDQIITRNVIKY